MLGSTVPNGPCTDFGGLRRYDEESIRIVRSMFVHGTARHGSTRVNTKYKVIVGPKGTHAFADY
jgi:hypothetical protein